MTTAANERGQERWGSPLVWIAALQVLLTLVDGRPVYDRLNTFEGTALQAVWQGLPPVIE